MKLWRLLRKNLPMGADELYIIIPAYNEEKHLATVLKRVRKYSSRIVVIDDGSKDKTSERAEQIGVTVLKHPINLGKGAALKTGCDYAVQQGAKILIVMDSDGQHEPEDIPRFLEALKGKDIVFGSRKKSKNMPAVLKFGNWFLNESAALLFRIRISDTQSGFRAFTAKAYKKIRWEANNYSMETEMITNVRRNKLKYDEIFIKTIYGDKYKGTTVVDGMKIFLNMLWWRITRW
ncbi:MAG: glycosyltransferase family 2 protein [Candidatus Nanoarchaeia archaeon]